MRTLLILETCLSPLDPGREGISTFFLGITPESLRGRTLKEVMNTLLVHMKYERSVESLSLSPEMD